jgi:hypothetical protein
VIKKADQHSFYFSSSFSSINAKSPLAVFNQWALSEKVLPSVLVLFGNVMDQKKTISVCPPKISALAMLSL